MVVTCGYHFQLQCHIRLVLINYSSKQLKNSCFFFLQLEESFSIIIIVEPKLKNVVEIWGFSFNDYQNNQTYDL